jgi:hypothetical protein
MLGPSIQVFGIRHIALCIAPLAAGKNAIRAHVDHPGSGRAGQFGQSMRKQRIYGNARQIFMGFFELLDYPDAVDHGIRSNPSKRTDHTVHICSFHSTYEVLLIE